MVFLSILEYMFALAVISTERSKWSNLFKDAPTTLDKNDSITVKVTIIRKYGKDNFKS